jgi:hypothetical protein
VSVTDADIKAPGAARPSAVSLTPTTAIGPDFFRGYARTTTPVRPTSRNEFVWNCWTMAGTSGTISVSSSRLVTFPVEINGSQQIVRLKILVVGQDLVERHPRAEQFKKHLDRVTESPNARLTETDGRVDRDASK